VVTWRRVRQPHLAVALLCAVPFIDVIVDQLYNALQLGFGLLSLPQIVRGCLLAIAWVLMVDEGRQNAASHRIHWAVLAIPAIFLVVTALEIVTTGQAYTRTIVACFQIVYWCTMWALTARTITQPLLARKVLTAFAFGSLITAVSVALGYVTGATLTRAYHDVRASAGFFGNGKGIAGSLAASAFIFAYMSAQFKKKVYLLFGAFCTVATFLTYARAGIVGLLVAAAWSSTWALSRKASATWARRFIGVVGLSVGLLIFAIGVSDLGRRWADVLNHNHNKAGSGRVLLWTLAWDSFIQEQPSQQLFGLGVEGMYKLTYLRLHTATVGHTHSDLFDILLIAGVVGLLAALTLPVSIFKLGALLPSRSPEYGLFWSIGCIMLAQALLTGQFFLPDTMAYYLVTMTAVVSLHACQDSPTVGRGRPRLRILVQP
jgi:hypothetical protein